MATPQVLAGWREVCLQVGTPAFCSFCFTVGEIYVSAGCARSSGGFVFCIPVGTVAPLSSPEGPGLMPTLNHAPCPSRTKTVPLSSSHCHAGFGDPPGPLSNNRCFWSHHGAPRAARICSNTFSLPTALTFQPSLPLTSFLCYLLLRSLVEQKRVQ